MSDPGASSRGTWTFTLVWTVLILATVASWVLSRDVPLGERLAASFVIAIAFLKVRLVGRYFMELRTAPRLMGAAFDLWLLIAGAILIWLACFGGGSPTP